MDINHVTDFRDATKHDLEPYLNNFDANVLFQDVFIKSYVGFPLVILISVSLLTGFMLITSIASNGTNPKRSKNVIKNLFIFLGSSCVLILYILLVTDDFKDIYIQKELKQNNPHFESIRVKGEIDDISNGSNRDNQELRFNDGKHIYYVTIPSDTIVRSGDSIDVSIKNRLADKNTKDRVLSDAINKPENKVTIKHKDQINHSHIIFNHEKEDNTNND